MNIKTQPSGMCRYFTTRRMAAIYMALRGKKFEFGKEPLNSFTRAHHSDFVSIQFWMDKITYQESCDRNGSR